MCHSTITRIKQPALLVISLFFVDFYLFIFFWYGSLGVEITFFSPYRSRGRVACWPSFWVEMDAATSSLLPWS